MIYSEERIKNLAFKIHDRLYMEALVDYTDEEKALSRIKEIMMNFFSIYDELIEISKKKISSLKKNIVQGSAEWDILYNKYLEEELAKRNM
ncbi:MAG: DUF507 family protein [Deltaproteobacteria bacterium]|nr:DUF507 family protein [Deltaproteobacteria bacterium]